MDCAESETKDGHIDRIDWWFQPTGDLTGEPRTRMLEIVRRCPVHRALVSENEIRPPQT